MIKKLSKLQKRVLDALQSGQWVSNQHFIYSLNISRAPARIRELREMGYIIKTHPKKDRYGKALYRLEGPVSLFPLSDEPVAPPAPEPAKPQGRIEIVDGRPVFLI